MQRIIVLLAAILTVPTAAGADIRDCGNATNDPGPKILLDDITTASGDVSVPPQLLASRLDAGLEQVRTELGVDLKVLPCPSRRPDGPSDFTREIVDQLNNRDVFMEVWGVTMQSVDAAGTRMNEASIGYLLVLARLEELRSARPRGSFTIPLSAPTSAPVDDMVRLVDQAGRLSAYATLAAGAKALASDRWDDARKQLCAARLRLKMLDHPIGNDTALADYAQTLAAEAVARARSDAGYRGFLKLNGVSPSCSPGQ